MAFIADDLAAWLIGLLADTGRRRLTNFVLGDEQERALERAAAVAVERTAGELYPEDDQRAGELAMVINEVFGRRGPEAPLAAHTTLLEALQSGIAGQLAVLDDANSTGTGQSSAQLLGVSGRVLTQNLARHLVREIISRGSRGGGLSPLADQLNHDLTHLQGQRLENMMAQLTREVREALVRLDVSYAAAPVALAQLPPPVTGFTGRDAELAEIAMWLNPTTAGSAAVLAVAGMPGIGKTALAVQAGYAALAAGRFAGGTLFIDLHGYDDMPVEPEQALDAFLRALGVPADDIPLSADDRGTLYRSVLAGRNEPLLVIADNASSEAQVQPLLPGGGPHRLVVTSRHNLGGLPARLLDLGVLRDKAALALIDDALRTARPRDDRISGNLEEGARLAQECAGLPLALQITAAILRADPALTAGQLADELDVEAERLARLRYDDGRGVAAPSVAAAFELSYRRLDALAARVFRLLAAHPGPDASEASLAVLMDLPATQVRTALRGLARAHLVEAGLAGDGRRRMHDLLRLYAQRLSDDNADADGRERAIDRLMGYFLSKARAADKHLQDPPGTVLPDDFSGRTDSLEWLDAERPGLVAAVSIAAETSRDHIALHLPMALANYLHWRRRFDDLMAILTVSLAASRRMGDRNAEAGALNSLGLALQNLRNFDEAVDALRKAVSIFRKTGDFFHESVALSNLGLALQEMGRFGEAIEACRAAIEICREIDDRNGEGKALNNLGMALRQLGQFDVSITAHQAAAEIFGETGDRSSEGRALHNLGMAFRRAGKLREAATAYEDAMEICQETGDRDGEGMALNSLGLALRDGRQFKMAEAAHRQAAAIFQEVGDRKCEGDALNYLGLSLRGMRRLEEAVSAHRDYLTICQEIGDRHGEGIAFNNLGLALQETGQYDEAIVAHMQASVIYHETGDQDGQSRAQEYRMRTWFRRQRGY